MHKFIINNFDISNEEIALINKIRWQIELLFKKLKQNLQLHYFYSETENGIKPQIWITLIAQLLLTVLKAKKAFSTTAALVRIHLISNLDVFWVIENSRRTYTKQLKRTKPPNLQAALF
jgi:IS4 transposase